MRDDFVAFYGDWGLSPLLRLNLQLQHKLNNSISQLYSIAHIPYSLFYTAQSDINGMDMDMSEGGKGKGGIGG